MRFFKFLLIMPFICYGGIKGYIWYSVKSNLDKEISKVSPFMDISYGGIFSTLSNGEVGLEEVVIRPKMTSDEFTIEEISFATSDLVSLFVLRKKFRDRKFPEYLDWKFKKVGINFNSEIFDIWQEMNGQQGNSRLSERKPLIERMGAMGCGDVVSFSLDDFIGMGYEGTNADFDIDITYDENLQLMKINLHLKDRDLYDASFKFQFPYNPIRFRPSDPRSMEPDISVMNVEYTDTGYYKLRNKYCASKRGDSVEDFVNANIQIFSDEVDAQLPGDTIEAYRQFLTSGGTIVLGIDPVERVKLSSMQFYKVSDALRLLSMAVSINGVNVDFEKVKWAGENSVSERKAGPSEIGDHASVKTKSSAKSLTPGKSKPTIRQYISVKSSNLDKYIGKPVRVETANGRVREGVLESVSDNKIRIMVKFGSGDFSFPVRRDEIVKTSVYL